MQEKDNSYLNRAILITIFLFISVIIIIYLQYLLSEVSFIISLIYEIFSIVFILIIFQIDGRINNKDMGINFNHLKESVIIGLLMGSGTLFAGFITFIPISLHPNWILYYLILFILVGMSEELYFRGYIYANLEKYIDNKYITILVTSGLFMAIHVPKFIFILVQIQDILSIMLNLLAMISALESIFIVGFVFTLVYRNIRNISSVIIGHFLYNFSIILFTGGLTSTEMLYHPSYYLFIFVQEPLLMGCFVLAIAWSYKFEIQTQEDLLKKYKRLANSCEKKKNSFKLCLQRLEDKLYYQPSRLKVSSLRTLVNLKQARLKLEVYKHAINSLETYQKKHYLDIEKEVTEEIYEIGRDHLELTKYINKLISFYLRGLRYLPNSFNCLSCNLELSENNILCEQCLLKMGIIENSNKFCAKCGTKIPLIAKFCPKCGHFAKK